MSLKHKTIKGLIWSSIAQGSKIVCNFAVTMVLARLLSPDDFGLLGMATVFTGFITVFADMGISRALIQRQNIDERHLSSSFWLNVVVGILLSLVFLFASPLIAAFYKKTELVPVLNLLSLNFIFASFTIVQQTILTKEMDFRTLTIRDIFAIVVSGVIGIILAYRGYGVWSLVFQTLIYTIVNSIYLWVFSKWKPRLIFSFSAIKDIFNYSANVTGFNVVNYFARNIDYLLIGKFLGAQALGYYTLAYKLMLVPLQNVSWVITKVMFPAFSKIQHDIEKVRNAYLKMIEYISAITFPLMCGLFAVAPEFIRVIYGTKWESVIFLIQVFSICGLLQSIYTTTTSIILSQGKSELLFRLSLLNFSLVAIAVIIGLHWGIRGVTIAYTIEQLIWIMYVQFIANSLIKLTTNTFISPLFKKFTISLLAVLPIVFVKLFFQCTSLYCLIVYIAIVIITYALLFLNSKNIGIQSVVTILRDRITELKNG